MYVYPSYFTFDVATFVFHVLALMTIATFLDFCECDVLCYFLFTSMLNNTFMVSPCPFG